MGRIRVKGMEFYAYHGHFAEEQVVGNDFVVNVWLDTDLEKAADTDDLKDALDYQQVYAIVKEEMHKPSKLLEKVADRILMRFSAAFPQAKSAKITIEKMNPPLGGKIKSVGVELKRRFV
jgi:7,8-dihydroneopterin aldolase/epimerase/oxygenase